MYRQGLFLHSGECQNPGWSLVHRAIMGKPWVPAFAGMTGREERIITAWARRTQRSSERAGRLETRAYGRWTAVPAPTTPGSLGLLAMRNSTAPAMFSPANTKKAMS